MRRKRQLFGVTCWPLLAMALAITGPALAQKPGGILKLYNIDSPASMSIHEEATVFSQMPMMAVFNNLVMFDQHVKQNSLQVIVPDLAISWSWDEEGKQLTFKLRPWSPSRHKLWRSSCRSAISPPCPPWGP